VLVVGDESKSAGLGNPPMLRKNPTNADDEQENRRHTPYTWLS